MSIITFLTDNQSRSRHRRHTNIEPGIINELIVPDVLYSSMIGLRYLNDVLRDFYVPSTLDSGVKLISREELADESH